MNATTIPVAVFYGGNDTFVDPIDANRTIKELGGNVKFTKYVLNYSHNDFMWGKNADEDIYQDAITFLNQYNI